MEINKKGLDAVFEAFKYAQKLLGENRGDYIEYVNCDAFFNADGSIAKDNSGPIRIGFVEHAQVKKFDVD